MSALLAAVGYGLGACTTISDQPLPNLVGVIQHGSGAVVGVGDASSLYGSGFRLAGYPFVVTAAHVVKPITGATFVKWRGKEFEARIVAVDEATDLAIIEIGGTAPLPGIPLAALDTPLPPGEWIVVLGCPFGAAPTATTGIISAKPGAVLKPPTLVDRIQLNATVNSGNSGGPVLNLRGQVVGVANATIPGGHGLSFATPADSIRKLLNTIGRKP